MAEKWRDEGTCDERIDDYLKSRLKAIRKLVKYEEGRAAYDPEYGSLSEFGVAVDYVPAETFPGQKYGYFRWQIGVGGPQDEFRFLTQNPRDHWPEIEYWFLDWNDGACREMKAQRKKLLQSVWQYFQEICAIEAASAGHVWEAGDFRRKRQQDLDDHGYDPYLG